MKVLYKYLGGLLLYLMSSASLIAQDSELTDAELTFARKGTGMGLEEWVIGRTSNTTDPPVSDFRIYRFGIGTAGGATFNTALYIQGSNMLIGMGNIIPSQKLDVDGNGRFRSVGSGAFNSTLNITSDGTLTTSSSDLRLKENITSIENPLQRVLDLRGISFNWKNDKKKEKRIGVVAQEVEKVLPELVYMNEVDGYKGVRYQELSALLIEAVKEQQQIIENQQDRISELEKMSARLDKVEKMLGVVMRDQ